MSRPAPTARPALMAAAAGLLTVVAGCAGAPQAQTFTTATPGYAVALTLDRPTVGDTLAVVQVSDPAAGGPVDADQVTIAPVMTQMGHSTPVVTAEPSTETGRYEVTGPLFFMDGVWDVEVRVEGPAGAETARFRVLISN